MLALSGFLYGDYSFLASGCAAALVGVDFLPKIGGTFRPGSDGLSNGGFASVAKATLLGGLMYSGVV